MSEAIAKTDMFARLGYAGSYQLLDLALAEVGLSRPDKAGIAPEKIDVIRRVLAERFVILCARGDCQASASDVAEGRLPVAASSPDECAVCGGSANARAVDEMVAAYEAAGLKRLCVVGGSPSLRVELERLLGGRLELRLVEGTTSRPLRQVRADLAWADRIAIWGGTILAHKVSLHYKGPRVIRFARRGIQELAREVVRSVG